MLTEKSERVDEGEATSHVRFSLSYLIALSRIYHNSSGHNSQILSEHATDGSFRRTLLFAATDTSSSAILRTLLVLAEHPDIQERVRQEILTAKAGTEGDLSYDKLLALPLLDAVYRETLRLSVFFHILLSSSDKIPQISSRILYRSSVSSAN